MKRTKRRISNRILRFARLPICAGRSVRENWRNRGRSFQEGGVQQVWTHSTREERGQVCEFREEFDPSGSDRGSALSRSVQGLRNRRSACPSFCLASAQLNSTFGRSFHKSHRVRSTRARPRACTFFAGSKKMGRAFFFLFFFLFSKTLY